jgi:hypothetical protein
MRVTRGAWALVLAIGACAPLPPQISVTEARALLVGRPAGQIAACMGAAPIQRDRDGVTLWSYPSPSALASAPVALNDPATASQRYTPLAGDPAGMTAGMPGFGVIDGPAAPAGCLVNITLARGVARTVTYVGPNGHLSRQDPECSELVRACVP